MGDVRTKYVAPSLQETAFNCPHCGALAKQYWFGVHVEEAGKDKTPLFVDDKYIQELDLSDVDDDEQREKIFEVGRKLATGLPFFEKTNSGYISYAVRNLSIARCFNCNELTIWVYNQMIHPRHGEAPLPNNDLSADVLRDYREASSILDQSPRGAAALLRLAIQKIAKELGGEGKNINDDIALLVTNGLDKRVQQALDVVRVIGNNAVHPGLIDLRDDRATAEKLFSLVNLIADIMISQPKHLQTMFDGLPENAKKAIEKRDGKP
jgi:hypothetical protein